MAPAPRRRDSLFPRPSGENRMSASNDFETDSDSCTTAVVRRSLDSDWLDEADRFNDPARAARVGRSAASLGANARWPICTTL